jgi:hypothetical protein
MPQIIFTFIPNFSHPYTIKPLALESEDGTYISAFIYTPNGEKNHGGIVVAHGFFGNKVIMQSMSIELVKRGFTVISIDFRGHGASGGIIDQREFIIDLKAAVDYLEYELSDITEIGLVGHSIGGGVALEFANTHPNRINATVSIGWISSEINGISNLLLTFGLMYSYPYIIEELLTKLTLYTGVENLSINEMYYGDFQNGSNIKSYISPFSAHIFEAVDNAIIYQTIQWFEQAFNGEIANDVFITATILQLFSFISLFGVILLNFILIVYLSNYIFIKKGISLKENRIKKEYSVSINKLIEYNILPIGIIQILFFLMLREIFMDDILFSAVNITVALLFGVAIGIIIFFIFFLFEHKKKYFLKEFPVKIKEPSSINSWYSVIFGILTSILLMISITLIWYFPTQNIFLSIRDIGMMIYLSLITFPAYLIKGFYFRSIQERLRIPNRVSEYFAMAIIGSFMDILLISVINLFGRTNLVYMPQIMLYLSVWLVISVIQQFTVTWVYIWSGSNILGSTFFSCIFSSWIVVFFLPSYGFL